MHKNERRYALFISSAVLLFAAGGSSRSLHWDVRSSSLSNGQVKVSTVPREFIHRARNTHGHCVRHWVHRARASCLCAHWGAHSESATSVWRYAIVGIVFIAAAITPSGDPVSLASLSVPMILLYFAAIGVDHSSLADEKQRGEH